MRIRHLQSNFTGGAVTRNLLGRGDLRAFGNGAARLRNVFIQPTGGIVRRGGLRYVEGLGGPARLVAFEFNIKQHYLLAFTDGEVSIFRGGALIATVATPWSGEDLFRFSWTQSADTLLVCHPDHPPRRLIRDDAENWSLTQWPVKRDDHYTGPFKRFADPDVTLRGSSTTGTMFLYASVPLFTQGHVGAHFRLRGREVRVVSIMSATRATAEVIDTLHSRYATVDWDEAAWTEARGWPATVTFHQDRLVVGGSRDMPNNLWMSRSGDIWHFGLGDGLDDQGIDFPILSDQVNAIRAIFSGRHLQVFTSGAEWMVTGDPVTPERVQIRRQTRIGSPTSRFVPPRDVEGATLFVSREGGQIREFLYADAEQAYRSTDLALLVRDLVGQPIDQDFDPVRRILFVVTADGRMALLTAYREEQVTAWTELVTDGLVQSVAVVAGDVYVAVTRAGGTSIEVIDDTVLLDSFLRGMASDPVHRWSGLGHLEGRTVRVLADGVDRGAHQVIDGAVELDIAARDVLVGLPYAHEIEPLPPFLPQSQAGGTGAAMRPVRTMFRLIDTASLMLDTGGGVRDVPLRRMGAGTGFDAPPSLFTGDRTVRHLGWRRRATEAHWRIEQDTPLPFALLSVTTELKVND
ncbi:hypothetical protein [Fodinicurvata sp. EGI_FJ10296]|uniref:hypothetical protein n=1 Tax=Fodinicurvata sp. EGI_FJ10296 TaxID=3231908 RepID=UPI003456051C